jgi:hypothetical protein
MKMTTLTIYFLVLTMCSAPHNDESVYHEVADLMDFSTASQAPVEMKSTSMRQKSEQSPMVIRTGNMEIEVKEITDAQVKLKQTIDQYKGSITNESTNNYPGRNSLNYTIRVDASQFDSFLAEVEKIGIYLTSKSINGRDVTEEFIDNEARLKNQKLAEEKYRELLKQAKTVADIIQVENELARIRQDIESREARSQYLKDQVAMSTLYLNMYQQIEVVANSPSEQFGKRLIRSIYQGWKNVVSFTLWMLSLWPFIILFVVIGYWWRRRRNKK